MGDDQQRLKAGSDGGTDRRVERCEAVRAIARVFGAEAGAGSAGAMSAQLTGIRATCAPVLAASMSTSVRC